MEIKQVVEKIKSKIISLYKKVYDYCSENKKQSLFIALLVLFILILLLVLASISSKNNKKLSVEEKPFILSEKLLVPKGPDVQEDYNITRTPKDKWSTEEADTWFTIPSSKDIESLGKTNDEIISEILGAAP